ncbi:DUF5666 domain-containing protein [Arthrobacter sp. ISL-28]|uniref:DUF5666 domain-containing protein n=1 Tax=Arthrobacter sp. ISL-28 TaxID=2819108 RepID=UPI001BEB625B|nr:DUF5666 domain-containing protein [Arthrobacter sp. ISL-28]MBT2520537.1 hypothetical protein [Arthrobacter sp. ISL-28]
MPVHHPNTLRRAVLAGAVVLALTGAGGAMVWAAGEPAALRDATLQDPAPQLVSPQDAAPPPASEGPGKSEKSQGQGKGRELRGGSVVKKGDGSLKTRIIQFGTVESVSESSITVKSEDGFSQVYAITAETKIRKQPAAAADGTAPKGSTAPSDDAGERDDDERVNPSAATAADIKQGDTVRIKGTRAGDTVTATMIRTGAKGKGPGQGKGLTQSKGPGQGKGLGHGKAKGEGRGQPEGGPSPVLPK